MALLKINKLKQNEKIEKEISSAEESDASEDSEQAEPSADNHAGWADSIAKVLSTNKPKAKKTLVLSRAKKLKPETKKAKTAKEEFGFEVAAAEFNEENNNEKIAKTEKIKKEKNEKDVKPKNLKLALRIKPSWQDLERERALKKVATKGVVQLFNAVRMQQKNLQEELEAAGPLDSRRDAVLNNIDKRKFLDVLMSGTRAKSEYVDGKVKKEEDESSSSSDDEVSSENGVRKKKTKWSVLEPDFLTNKKAKHWDEEEDDDQADIASDASDESDED